MTMPIWTLAKKDLRLLLRDRRAVVILFAMPLIFILVLGLSLGQGFGQKPDARLRVSIVDLDQGYQAHGAARDSPFGTEPWSHVVQRDLAQTAGIRLEVIPSEAEARRLIATSQRAAVLVFGPNFTERVRRCSFLAEGINPFYRNGVKLSELDVALLEDETQLTAASIIEQVAQVTLLRVVLPWMIGRAFEKIGDPDFIDRLSRQKGLPGLLSFTLRQMPAEQKKALGESLQKAIQNLYPKYNLTAKTWAALTKSAETPAQPGAEPQAYVDEGGAGLLKRGAANYQRLVPSQTVMFAFFLVLTVGWLFTGERRQGTLKRLRAAPLSRGQILLGKLVPCFALSLAQGLFLLGAGRVVFGMSWGPDPLWLLPVVVATSLAAMGLALLVAALARTETQVAIYGTLLVLVLAGVSGCLMGDRELMPELMQRVSLLTPQAWSLVAYKQLLTTSAPNLALVAEACAMLTAFGLGFVALAWWALQLD
jgi:ABC-type Na+ efflux pump permease subunit